jgi:osmotically-inducible protein OsmY
MINPDEYSRCNERIQSSNPGRDLNPTQKTDAAIKENVYHAFWKDDVLRAIEYDEIEIHVKSGVVHLNGHIVGTSSRSRIEHALRDIPGILRVNNNLVLDDKLTLEVASSLGTLEHTYNCKFFTGTSHGVVSLNGIVSAENVKLLAEMCAASNPKVRGVINHIRVAGAGSEFQDPPFLQPTPGEIIYFLDGVAGIVKRVIVNPNNRRVTAMILEGNFNDQGVGLNSMTGDKARFQERLVAVSMNEVRYLTRVSGFLYINSHEKNRLMDFDPGSFIGPDRDWVPPHPYCREDVLFPADCQTEYAPQPIPFTVPAAEASLEEYVVANDSPGG